MQPGAAIRRRGGPSLPLPIAALAGAALLAGCAGPGREVAPLTAELAAQCREVEAAYRSGAADYVQRRDALVKDADGAAWLTRIFIVDLFHVREGRPLGGDVELMRSAAGIVDPREAGAKAQIRELGALAVPTLVADLLCHAQPQPRELGIELLAMIGQPAVGPVQQVAADGDSQPKRAAARTLGRIGVDGPVFTTLRALAADGDFAVRADALRSLRTGGEPAVDLLVQRLRDDPDPYVRRVAAETLGGWKATATAQALVDYLERCKQERDWPGERAAQASLQRMAGSKGPRTPSAWRAQALEFGPLSPSPAAGPSGSVPGR